MATDVLQTDPTRVCTNIARSKASPRPRMAQFSLHDLWEYAQWTGPSVQSPIPAMQLLPTSCVILGSSQLL